MKLRGLLFGLAAFLCVPSAFGAATNCKKDFVDLITVRVLNRISLRSGGHFVSYSFNAAGEAFVFVDGELRAEMDATSVTNEINSLCGPGFVEPGKILTSAEKSTRAVAAASPAAGETNQEVVVGDFNGDGVPDSAIVTGRGVLVTLHRADGTALSSTLYPVKADTGPSIVAVDFNGDGRLDLAITQGAAPTENSAPPGNVVVLLGNADGTFGAPTSFPVGAVSSSSYLATGDFNGDGFADLAMTNFTFPQPGTISVLLGKGDGTFAPAATYPGGGSTLIAADFNGDGKLDLASLGDNVSVMFGRGDGSFQAPVLTAWGKTYAYLGYADLNHDGKLDLLIADRDASSMVEMLGNGDGTFQARKEYLVSAQPRSIAILPLGDGNTSLVTADNAGSNNLYLSFVTPDGAVRSPQLQAVGTGPAAVAAADLNGDRQPDLVISDSETGNIYVKVASGKGQFGNPVAYPTGSHPGALAIADLNGDGKADVIAADTAGLDVLLGKGDGTLGAAATLPSGVALSSVTVADFNGDGKPDVAAVTAPGGGVSLFLNNGTAGGSAAFQPVRTIPLINALSAVSGDFNGDGKADLIVAAGLTDFQTAGTLAVLLGKGDGTFQVARTIALAAPLLPSQTGRVTSTALAVGDMNGDGKLDVIAVLYAASGTSQSQIAVLLGNGDGTFQAPVLTSTNTAPPAIVMAEMNGDGKADLVLADCCGLSEASLLLGNGDGTFQAEQQFPSGPDPKGVAVADFNGDGQMDLAIVGHVATANRGTLAVVILKPPSSSTGGSAPVITAVQNGASYQPGGAVGSWVQIKGTNLATGTGTWDGPPSAIGADGTLPTTLGGAQVTIGGMPAAIFFFSTTQLNVQVPNLPGPGDYPVQVSTSSIGTSAAFTLTVSKDSPGFFLFTPQNQKYIAGLTQDNKYLGGPSLFPTLPMRPAKPGEIVQLFGTGFGPTNPAVPAGKAFSGTAPVTGVYSATIGGLNARVGFLGQVSGAGLYQINLTVPNVPDGDQEVLVSIDGVQTQRGAYITVQANQ